MMKRVLLFFGISLFSLSVLAQKNLVVLHTNDTHSQIEPYVSKEIRSGGVLARMEYLKSVRDTAGCTLLLDAGDFSQGSPYFNVFKGVAEIELMNMMRYDVVTLGNHEFDFGCKALGKRLKKADFQVVCANYQFKDRNLKKIVKPYVILEKCGYRIGVFGLTVNMEGLVFPETLKEVTYLSPIEKANEVVQILKNEKHCDFVICLSHLGYDTENLNDQTLADQVVGIDLIIGGHTHTTLQNPYQVGKTMIVQTGSKGRNVGRVVVGRE